ncbi:hypothetical protein C4E04_17835 [Microvirga sp. 17 mud 1-3]|nr:hypothetical protein C4E04_17835 [Microvirga sp. 17 mud 1-3]
MGMMDLHKQIADLEAEIEALSEAATQCRKSMIVAKVAVGAGILLLVGLLFGLFGSAPIVLVIGIASTLAGAGFYGSGRSTLEQISATARACEDRRDRIIDELNLQTVQGP